MAIHDCKQFFNHILIIYSKSDILLHTMMQINTKPNQTIHYVADIFLL